MKKLRPQFVFVCIILIGLLSIVGCGDSDGDGEPVTGHFTANISGQPFVPHYKCCRERGNGIEIWGVTEDELQYIQITAAKPNQLPATIALGPGINQLDWAMYDTNSEITGGEYYTYSPSSGSVTINQLTAGGCSGSFTFRAKIRGTDSEINISNGIFDVGTASCIW